MIFLCKVTTIIFQNKNKFAIFKHNLYIIASSFLFVSFYDDIFRYPKGKHTPKRQIPKGDNTL